jgi:hypothetical protein
VRQLPTTIKHIQKWQEVSRKNVECAFWSLFKGNFYVLMKGVEWYISDITKALETCDILHEMKFVDWDEREFHNWYEFNNKDAYIINNIVNNNNDPNDTIHIKNNDTHHLQQCFLSVLQLIWRWRIICNNMYCSASIKRHQSPMGIPN